METEAVVAPELNRKGSHLSFHYCSSMMDMSDVRKSIEIGNYMLKAHEIQYQSVIGEGAMAVVYKAKLRDKKCAAKKLKCASDGNSQEYNDLVVELGILATVGDHPNLVHFYGACIEDIKCPIILEELMEGGSLQGFLSSLPPRFTLKRANIYGWALDIFRGLDHLHNREPIIMHRYRASHCQRSE
jgi:serine/threonine protein kinase